MVLKTLEAANPCQCLLLQGLVRDRPKPPVPMDRGAVLGEQLWHAGFSPRAEGDTHMAGLVSAGNRACITSVARSLPLGPVQKGGCLWL